MDINEYKQRANLIRDNEIYKVYDLPQLQNLNISLTELHPGKDTTGHAHKDADEVYIFIDGKGRLDDGEQSFEVKSGDIILVPRGNFHRAHNTGENILRFWSIFEKYEGRN